MPYLMTALFLWLSCQTAMEREDMRGRFVIETTINGCKADVRLNDVHLIAWPGEFGNEITWFANQWILTGENEIKVELDAPPEEVKARPSFKAELNYYEPDGDGFVGEAPSTTIATLEWSPPEGAEIQYPVNLFASGSVVDEQPKWAWVQAEVVGISPEALQSGVEIVNSLVAAIRAKDAGKLDQLLELPNTETDLAYGLPKGSTAQGTIIKEAWNESGWDVKDVSIDDVSLSLQGKGRLLEVTDKEGGPIIQAIDSAEDYQIELRVFLSKIDGKLVISR